MALSKNCRFELCFEETALDLCGEGIPEGLEGPQGSQVGTPLPLSGETVKELEG